MKNPYQRMKGNADRNPLRNDRGDISIFTCFFVVACKEKVKQKFVNFENFIQVE